MLVTLRDTPSDAEIPSHQLLARGGYIRRVSTGIYSYMPLMWKVLSKIIAIVQKEMDNKGALQALLPQLHPAELWEMSGRWKGYTEGEGIMFNLQDRQGRAYGLGPTHEEVATKIIGEQINSYKQLPINLYQIQTKFRDEIRPRFGLMRSREFIMKDAYSFHANQNDLRKTYKEMDDAYTRIFQRCGIQIVKVEADSGAIGGGASQEFMVPAESGEDLILKSNDGKYAANEEKAISNPPKAKPLKDSETRLIETQNQSTIKELCSKQNLDPSQIVKVVIFLATLEEGKPQPVLVSIRGDQEINEVKLRNAIGKEIAKKVIHLSSIKSEHLIKRGNKSIPFGYIAPDLNDSALDNISDWENHFLRLVDFTAADLNLFVCGANIKNQHRYSASWESLKVNIKKVDIRKARANDQCIHDQNQTLEECRGIEIGHIFQLGKKYSTSLDVSFTNEEGATEPFWMGCYGIGISRLAQAAVEQHHDEAGIKWPISIAPFEIIISIANVQDEIQKELGEKIYKQLSSEGFETLLDDRNERAGVKFKDADLIGIPWRIIVGRGASSNQIELIERSTKIQETLSTEIGINKLINKISKK